MCVGGGVREGRCALHLCDYDISVGGDDFGAQSSQWGLQV